MGEKLNLFSLKKCYNTYNKKNNNNKKLVGGGCNNNKET